MGLTGYWMGYSPNDDHHVGRLVVDLSPMVNDNVVTVNATLGVRDWSGNWDDSYQGTVDFVVMADLEDPSAIPPRADMLVTGMEFNQAIQYFRSATYLDAAHVHPDNAIPLVARRNTGVRVYVDYDASAGLPLVAQMTGRLTVETGTTTLTLNPINPGGSIAPQRDAQINMTVRDHTLNFLIPSAYCTGQLTLTCEVWDQANPGTTSAGYRRTVVFIEQQPLNYYVVGVNYTAVNPSVPAPTLAQFTSQHLPDVVRTYPVGDIVVNGYTTINLAKTVTYGNVTSGCGSGFDDLLNTLSDMRGGSGDVYVGILGPGIMGTPGNQVGGCGEVGAVGIFLDRGFDLPHETGHAFGRKHAPCTQNRCNPAPGDVDPTYPQYGTFPSDSIGAIGFDATTGNGVVFNPASTFDIMAYSSPNWVSAYTYGALGGSFATTGAGFGASNAHMLGGIPAETLYLGLTIDRARKVTRRPSFHFPGIAQTALKGEFVVDLVDAKGDVLACTPLTAQAGCGCCGCCGDNCWPRRFRQAIPWPDGVTMLRIWEGRDQIYEEKVAAPPRVRVRATELKAGGVTLHWTVGGGGEGKGFWYMVHWCDDDGRWRGVAPRQQGTSLLIPTEQFVNPQLKVRVLATSGLATGFAELVIDAPQGAPGGPGPGQQPPPVAPGSGVVLVGDPVTQGPPGDANRPSGAVKHSSEVMHAIVPGRRGRRGVAEQIYWYDEHGVQLERGAHLDTRRLPQGTHTLTVVVRGHPTITATWLVAIRGDGLWIHRQLEPSTAAEDAGEPGHRHPHPPPDHD